MISIGSPALYPFICKNLEMKTSRERIGRVTQGVSKDPFSQPLGDPFC
jgi:hypothetical protein